MESFDNAIKSEQLLKCPYDPNHNIPRNSFFKHLDKCKSPYKDLYTQCPFNPFHYPRKDPESFRKHCQSCPQRLKILQVEREGLPFELLINDQNSVVRNSKVSQSLVESQVRAVSLQQQNNNQNPINQSWISEMVSKEKAPNKNVNEMPESIFSQSSVGYQTHPIPNQPYYYQQPQQYQPYQSQFNQQMMQYPHQNSQFQQYELYGQQNPQFFKMSGSQSRTYESHDSSHEREKSFIYNQSEYEADFLGSEGEEDILSHIGGLEIADKKEKKPKKEKKEKKEKKGKKQKKSKKEQSEQQEL